MARRCLTAIVALIVCTALHAQQVTIQHGSTLSQLISNLYGGDGIQLANTGHQAHFGKTGDFQGFTSSLQSVLQSRSFIPIPSAVGLVSYHFNEATGTYERVEGSLGPILAERGSTTGKGNLNVSLTYTFADYQRINGKDSIELVLTHCLTPDCIGSGGTIPAFAFDTIHVRLHFRLKSQALALSAVYGINNRLDVGLVIPYVRNDLQVFTHGFIVVAPGSSPTIHFFDPNVETPDQFGTATAVGIGDTVARAKLRLATHGGIDSAVMTDLTLPTGDKENFLGNGRTKIRVAYIASKAIRGFMPHMNVGYELRFGETKLDAFDYRIGTEITAGLRLTLSTEILGVVRQHSSSLFRSAILGNERLVARSEIDGTVGGKWKLAGDRAFVFNLLLPLNTAGIRPTYVVTAGVQTTF